jgi:hypothetical protein
VATASSPPTAAGLFAFELRWIVSFPDNVVRVTTNNDGALMESASLPPLSRRLAQIEALVIDGHTTPDLSVKLQWLHDQGDTVTELVKRFGPVRCRPERLQVGIEGDMHEAISLDDEWVLLSGEQTALLADSARLKAAPYDRQEHARYTQYLRQHFDRVKAYHRRLAAWGRRPFQDVG